MAASSIVRLIKLLRGSAGLRFSAPGVQQCVSSCSLSRLSPSLTDSSTPVARSAAFNAGTVLAISAVEDGISANPRRDLERRVQARKDLRFVIECLKEIGTTWTTAHTSAGVLEGASRSPSRPAEADKVLELTQLPLPAALTSQFEAASSIPDQQLAPSSADVQYSPSLSSTSASSHASYPLFDDSATAVALQSLDLPLFLEEANISVQPRSTALEHPPTVNVDAADGSDLPTGAVTPSTATGYQTPSRLFGAGWLPSAAMGVDGEDDAAAFGGSSLPFLFPSWDRDDGLDDFMSLLNVPGCASFLLSPRTRTLSMSEATNADESRARTPRPQRRRRARRRRRPPAPCERPFRRSSLRRSIACWNAEDRPSAQDAATESSRRPERRVTLRSALYLQAHRSKTRCAYPDWAKPCTDGVALVRRAARERKKRRKPGVNQLTSLLAAVHVQALSFVQARFAAALAPSLFKSRGGGRG